MRLLLLALTLFAACADSETTEPDPTGDSQTRSQVLTPTPTPSTPPREITPTCAEGYVWDADAKACALFPGGGNGFAGCSQSTATEPPAGNVCITGSHWDHCDCVCDIDLEIWDATGSRCALYPGGGNGWAGCSQATSPPNNLQCITGTHWEPCDCVCDDSTQHWDADTQTCK
jgi:hypothetical protein